MTWAIFPEDKYARAVIELLSANLEEPSAQRSAAIIGGALLEDAVERTLRERLLNNEGLANNLLDFDKPLGNTGPQIDLLHLLGAFDEKTRSALQGLVRIRNYFAHHIDASFASSNEYLTKSLKRLTLHENRTHYPHHLFGPDTDLAIESVRTSQERFILNLKLGLLILMRDRISHEPYTNHPLTEAEFLAKYPQRFEKGPPKA